MPNDKIPYILIPRRLGIPYTTSDEYDMFNANPDDLNKKQGEHWHDRNPYTGKVLKTRKHSTYNEFVQGEQEVGSELYTDPYGDEYTFIPNSPDAMPYMYAPLFTRKEFPFAIKPEELARRQAYVESGYNPKAVSKADARGIFQIRPNAYQDYLDDNPNDKGDLYDPVYNKKVRDYIINKLYNSATINTNNPSEEVRLAKMLAAYNWGRQNLEDHLVALKNSGKDIYSDNSWMEGIPKETRDYVNYILFHQPTRGKNDNDYSRLKYMYNEIYR